MEMNTSDASSFLLDSNESMVIVEEECVARVLDDAPQNDCAESKKVSRSITATGGVKGNQINHLYFPELKKSSFIQGFSGGNSKLAGTGVYLPREGKGTGVFLPAATADYALAYKITVPPKKPRKNKKKMEYVEKEKKVEEDGVAEDVLSEYCLPQEWTY